MRKIDVSVYSAKKPSRIKPEKVSLGDLPPIKSKAERVSERSRERANERTSVQVNERAGEQVNGRTGERAYGPRIRCSFQLEIYQRDDLKRLQARRVLQGEEVDLSQMVREALDLYLGERVNERSRERTNG